MTNGFADACDHSAIIVVATVGNTAETRRRHIEDSEETMETQRRSKNTAEARRRPNRDICEIRLKRSGDTEEACVYQPVRQLVIRFRDVGNSAQISLGLALCHTAKPQLRIVPYITILFRGTRCSATSLFHSAISVSLPRLGFCSSTISSCRRWLFSMGIARRRKVR